MFTAMLSVAAYVGLGWGGAPTAWHSDYAQAVAEACNSDKPLFIVICSSSSEYGQLASLGTFLSDGVEGKLRTDYVRFMIDMDTAEGRELAQRFDVAEGPHFVILDRTCKWQVYYRSGTLLESDLSPVLARFRRSKLTASGRPIQEVARRQTVQLCST
jgi:hypothetical protein